MTGQVDRHWRCDCGGGHFLTLTWWPDDLKRGIEAEGYLNIEGDLRAGWRDRLAQAWRVIRSGHSATRVGLILDAAKAREVAGALAGFSDAAGPPRDHGPVPAP